MTRRPNIVFLLSGQGSQYFGMGREFFEGSAVFREVLERGDAFVRARLGTGVIDRLYGQPCDGAAPLDDIELSHPALFLVGYGICAMLERELGIVPDVLLGASLGELIGAVPAGILTFEEALGLVCAQAEALRATCEPGGMIAVLAAPELFENETWLHGAAELVGVNFRNHFVVACPEGEGAAIERELQVRRIVHQRLPVRHAFHSRWIDPLQGAVDAATSTFVDRKASRTFLSGTTGGCCRTVQPAHWWQVVRRPILFREALNSVSCEEPALLIDAGPAGTLAGFTRQNFTLVRREMWKVIGVLSPFSSNGYARLADIERELQRAPS